MYAHISPLIFQNQKEKILKIIKISIILGKTKTRGITRKDASAHSWDS
jgi:hypothetical protein